VHPRHTKELLVRRGRTLQIDPGEQEKTTDGLA